jgi:HEAT repeat protein
MLDLRELHNDMQVLESGNENSRRQTLQSLRNHDAKEWAIVPVKAVQTLVELLQHNLAGETKQTFIRQEIVGLLGNIGPGAEPAIPQLIDMLQEGIPDGVREGAAMALGKIGRESRAAVDPLTKLVSSARPTLVVRAIRALGEIGCADLKVRTALTDQWQSPSQTQNGQVQAAIALCKLHVEVKGLVRFLTSMLAGNQDASLRLAAAEALGWCDKNEGDVVPALLAAALNDKNEEVRHRAQASLDQLRLSRKKTIQMCSRQLKDSPYAETALRHSGQLAVPALIEALGAKESVVKEKAARILGSLGELAASAVPELRKVLRDREPEIRLAAAKGLWNITKNADDVVPVLVDLLEDGATEHNANESRRRFLQTVIEALQRIGPPAKAAIRALTGKTRDKNRLVSESALSALKEINRFEDNRSTVVSKRVG